jgi:glutamate/aspartate transport system substrate-binding protein
VGAAAPYGIMLRKDDAPFKKLADATTRALFTSAEFPAFYAKWFTSPIPPRNLNLDIPLAGALQKLFANPTDSPDPAAY